MRGLNVSIDVAEDPGGVPGWESEKGFIEVMKCLQISVRGRDVTSNNPLPQGACHYHEGNDVPPMTPE
jgi:hypothetical protein